MRILAVTNIYPSVRTPTVGTYVEQQIKGLRQSGLESFKPQGDPIQGKLLHPDSPFNSAEACMSQA